MANTNHLTGVLGRERRHGGAKHSSAVDESLHDEIGHCNNENEEPKWRQQRHIWETTSTKQSVKMSLLFLDRPAPRLWLRSNGSAVQKEKRHFEHATKTYTAQLQSNNFEDKRFAIAKKDNGKRVFTPHEFVPCLRGEISSWLNFKHYKAVRLIEWTQTGAVDVKPRERLRCRLTFNDDIFGRPLLVEGGETGFLTGAHHVLFKVKFLRVEAEEAEPQFPHRLSVRSVLRPPTGLRVKQRMSTHWRDTTGTQSNCTQGVPTSVFKSSKKYTFQPSAMTSGFLSPSWSCKKKHNRFYKIWVSA